MQISWSDLLPGPCDLFQGWSLVGELVLNSFDKSQEPVESEPFICSQQGNFAEAAQVLTRGKSMFGFKGSSEGAPNIWIPCYFNPASH